MKAAKAVLILAVAVAAAACEDSKTTPAPVQPSQNPLDSADQVLFGVTTNLVNGGLLRGVMLSDTVLMYEDNTRADLRKVNTTFFTQTGAKNGTLTAKRGTYHMRLGNMEARGDVVVVSEDGRRLETPHLKYDPQRNEISSDSAFVMTEANGRRVEGIGFVSDPNMNNIRILRAARGRGGSVTLPKS